MTQSSYTPTILPDLLALTKASLPFVNTVLAAATQTQSNRLSENGRVSATKLETNQTAAHGLAWLATYAQALTQMQAWAENLQSSGTLKEVDQLIHQIAFGEYLNQIHGGIPMNQGEFIRPQDIGLTPTDRAAFAAKPVVALMERGNTPAARARLAELIQEGQANTTLESSGLDEELEMIREQFRRFAVEKVEPFAHDWHLKDELIPMEIIDALAEMGVFGLTIPEEYGGLA